MCDSTRIFTCPFNQYHKLMEYRKWQFHVTRCGDRKGKTVYQCQYQPSHYYCDISQLIEHENTCEFKQTQSTRYDNTDLELAKNRNPMAVYCKYEVGHVFGTVAECQEHMKECPRREEFEKKAEQCHRKFSQNKAWIRAAQQAKKQKETELGGNINAPASNQMPNLRYQYCMNEPFVGGINASVQSSIEANVHKRRVAYDLDLEEEAAEQKMTIDQHKEKMKKELCSKIEQDIIVQGQSITTEDVDTLLVKQDREVEFGLKIKSRKHKKLTLFEFNIEKYINLKNFLDYTELDIKNDFAIREFLQDNFLMKLNVFNPNIDQEEKRQEWGEKALQVIDDIGMKQSMQNDVSSIYFNSIQGRKLNYGITQDLDTHNVYLFMITKETDTLGKFLKTEFLCDYMILKFEAPLKSVKSDFSMAGSNSEYESVDMEHFAQSRELRGINSKEKNTFNNKQVILLKDEKADLESQLKDKDEEIKRLTSELETANKSIYDKERQQMQDKRDITHKEGIIRLNKTKLNETIELLNGKETDLKNSEKRIEQLHSDIKKHELRFEKQKQRTEEFQSQYNEKTLALQKAQDLLSNANKIVRHKDNQINNQQQKINSYEEMLKKLGNLKTQPNITSLNPPILANNFVLNGLPPKKEENLFDKQKIEMLNQAEIANVNLSTPLNPPKVKVQNQKRVVQDEDLDTNTDDVKIDEEGVEDHEIIDDEEPDMEIIMKNKVRFEMRKLEQQKQNASESQSNLSTPFNSALNSKQKQFNQNPEDLSSVTGSKVKITNAELDKEGVDQLKERLLCVSCLQKPKCMLIQTCKHVPFCQDCDQEWKLKCTDQGKDHYECPICRIHYKKTTKIAFI